MKKIRVAVLGACGWMGRLHCDIYRNLRRRYGELPADIELSFLVGTTESSVAAAAKELGVGKYGTDWREAISDPDVDLVDICLPDALHYEVAKAALDAGKHVYCEKPFTDDVEQAAELVGLARQRGVITRVGHNFPINPVHRLAKSIIDAGQIGDITMFKFEQHVDSLADPQSPFIWRLDASKAPTGIVGDTGSHVFSFIDFLIGSIDEVNATCPILHRVRPYAMGAKYGSNTVADDGAETRDVTNPDAGFVLLKSKTGAYGSASFSRIATGMRFAQKYEIYGTKGAIHYDYDRLTSLRLFQAEGPTHLQGYRSIDVGPEDSDYAKFLPLPNFGLGFNEVKTIEIAQVIRSICENRPMWPTFDDAIRIVGLVDACLASDRSRRWESVG